MNTKLQNQSEIKAAVIVNISEDLQLYSDGVQRAAQCLLCGPVARHRLRPAAPAANVWSSAPGLCAHCPLILLRLFPDLPPHGTEENWRKCFLLPLFRYTL